MKKTGAAALLTACPAMLTKYARAQSRVIKIGLVSPETGPLAPFAEPDNFVVERFRKIVANGITVAGKNYPVQIIVKDSRSDPNRAAELASELIKSDKVDLITAAATGDTVNPVADQAEINGVPCVSTDCPWQVYFFGRGGKPDKGFQWTYHFFWGVEDLIDCYVDMWKSLPTNKVVGALWPNDGEGIAFSDAQRGFPPVLKANGFTVVDPGRFSSNITDYSSQIAALKRANCEIMTGVLPPPAFSTFWSQAAQQGYKPKIATPAKAILFPAAVNAIGDRALGLTTEVWWSPGHPFKSSLTGQTAAQLCAEYEKTTGKQWSPPLGMKHALFEVALDVFKRTKNLDSRESILEAIRTTNYDSVFCHVQWTGNPVKNVCKSPMVGGQWVRGTGKFKYNLLVCNNDHAKAIPVQTKMKLL